MIDVGLLPPTDIEFDQGGRDSPQYRVLWSHFVPVGLHIAILAKH